MKQSAHGRRFLIIGASLSFIAALVHIAIIFVGADWYRLFGAGEHMAQLAEAGSSEPTVITLAIATVLTVWGLYALSGAGVILRLPLMKTALCIISFVYLARGVVGATLPFISTHSLLMENSQTFWLVSSLVSSTFGLFYLLGTYYSWRQLA